MLKSKSIIYPLLAYWYHLDIHCMCDPQPDKVGKEWIKNQNVQESLFFFFFLPPPGVSCPLKQIKP